MALRVRKNRAEFPAGVVLPRAGGPHACPLNRVMDLLAGAWAPQVVWHLSGGPRRFGELRIDLPDVSARVLSQRLRELHAKGVITRVQVASEPPSIEYALTDLGRQLVPALAAITEIGKQLVDAPAMPTRKRGARIQ